jgi:hypothetical protein
LLDVLRSLAGTVNLIVTSRDLPPIALEFKKCTPMDIRASNEDVKIYIEGRIESPIAIAIHSEYLKGIIVSKIVKKVKGLYVSPPTLLSRLNIDISSRILLARLYMDLLEKKFPTAAVSEALNILPDGVHDYHEEPMEQIKAKDKECKDLSEPVFSWITYAFRPLSSNALAVES